MSKTELKRRQKQRQKAEEKQKKVAAAPVSDKPTAAKKPAGAASEKDLDPRQYYEIRCREIEGLLKTNDPNPYPHKFEVNYDPANFEKDYGRLKSGEVDNSKELRFAGRIFLTRRSGAKLIFYVIRTGADTKSIGVRLQVMCQAQNAKEGGTPFDKQHEHIARGDVIGIVGYPGRTAPKSRLDQGLEGELSLFASEIILLSPSLHSMLYPVSAPVLYCIDLVAVLPTEHFGFKDVEQRFRSRYLDLLFNDASRQVLWTRSKITKYIRDFFHEREFVEVETPMMTAIAGGATALPFVTHHNVRFCAS